MEPTGNCEGDSFAYSLLDVYCCPGSTEYALKKCGLCGFYSDNIDWDHPGIKNLVVPCCGPTEDGKAERDCPSDAERKCDRYEKYSVLRKQRSILGLLFRDLRPLIFDSNTNDSRARVSEYRGLLHWYRDVVEKVLSVGVVLLFNLFLAKGIGYCADFSRGDGWRLMFLYFDIAIAISLSGYFLIIDGFINISAMTDAPGISKMLDSVLVIMAGVLILQVDIGPSATGLVKFAISNPGLFVMISAILGGLFFIRWIIRNWTVREWLRSELKNRHCSFPRH